MRFVNREIDKPSFIYGGDLQILHKRLIVADFAKYMSEVASHFHALKTNQKNKTLPSASV
jgi:hypothetical protein